MVDDIDSSGNLQNPATWKERGNEQFNKGEYKKATECFARAIELDPDYLPAWNNLGYTLLKMGKIEEATRINKKIKEIKNKSVNSIPAPSPTDKSSLEEPINSSFSPDKEDIRKKYENGEISYTQYQVYLHGEETTRENPKK